MSWLDYLKSAKAEPYGIALICKDPTATDQAKRQLYLARAKARELEDKSFDDLSISMSPHSDDILYIYHKTDEGAPDAESLRTETQAGDDKDL